MHELLEATSSKILGFSGVPLHSAMLSLKPKSISQAVSHGNSPTPETSRGGVARVQRWFCIGLDQAAIGSSNPAMTLSNVDLPQTAGADETDELSFSNGERHIVKRRTSAYWFETIRDMSRTSWRTRYLRSASDSAISVSLSMSRDKWCFAQNHACWALEVNAETHLGDICGRTMRFHA